MANPHVFLGKTEEDKTLRDEVKEIIHRYYDCPEWGELVDEYGEEEARNRYRSPKQLFEEHKEELLNMTQVPQIRKMILNGPIRNANEIIISDIKDLYLLLKKEIQKISSEIASHRRKTIELSEASDVSNRISLLEKQIAEEKKDQREQAKRLSELLAGLESRSQNALNKIKS